MKLNVFKIILFSLILIIIVLGVLLSFRIIWFVYPNKNIYSVDGLDVSNHQGIIDWENIDEKYKFVFVKATDDLNVFKGNLEELNNLIRMRRL